jgi:hypothetical protein
MKITRRELAAALAAGPAALDASPQSEASAGDLLTAAKERIKADSEALAKESLPMTTEPAFQFKA